MTYRSSNTAPAASVLLVSDSLPAATSVITQFRHLVQRLILRVSASNAIDIAMTDSQPSLRLEDVVDHIPVPGFALVVASEAAATLAGARGLQAVEVTPIARADD